MTEKAFITLVEEKELILDRLETEPYGTNAYILCYRESEECLLIDAPGGVDAIKARLAGTKVAGLLITHGHPDHLFALEELYQALQTSLAVHRDDAPLLPLKPDRLLEQGDIIECGRLRVEVIHTPGHTEGGVCLKIGDLLIAGDTIFPGGPGKTSSADNFRTLLASIREKILTLPDQTKIFPGHGTPTTVGTERQLIEAFLARGYDSNLYGDVTWS